MKKTIYITDLDGTLLNSNKCIPQAAKTLLNELIEKQDIPFSVATARTAGTVSEILKDVKLKEPAILMNGAVLYDLEKHAYMDVAYISEEASQKVQVLLAETLKEGFIYTIENEKLVAYYNDLTYAPRNNFYQERKDLEHKKFVKGSPMPNQRVVYFVFIDTKERIEAIYNQIQEIPGIAGVMYQEVYDDTAYVLDVYSNEATKANGIRKLKQMGGYEKVVCFGDNLNDLPMFEVSDEAYAVENAVPEVKEKADKVIGSCEEGSVPGFIAAYEKDK